MSDKSVTLWKCDRCGEKNETSDEDAIPDGWKKLFLSSREDNRAEEDWVFCAPCIAMIVMVMDGAELGGT